ncbi:MAG: molybdopterin oxidoreductase family protein [Ardenticatenaceae bacterium]|nr:molybdopterin oxidoreductase family protein [Ardenticatenaceae bacterium]
MSAKTHYRTCNLCEAMCGLEIRVENNQIRSIKGDADDPFSRGHICPKATALQDIYEDPDRLKRPIKRTPDGWIEISWEDAYDEVVEKLKGIQNRHGRNSVAVYQGNPNVHNLGSMLYSPQFVRALRTKIRFSATSVDQLPHHYAAFFMFGHQLLLPIPDIDRTDFMLMLGANPLASNGSLMTAPGVKKRLRAIQKRGGQVVVVDPRKTETAAMADDHFFIRPGKDVLFLLSFLQVMFAQNLIDLGDVPNLVDPAQLDALQKLTSPFTPEKTAAQTGIEPERLQKLVGEFCAAERAVCYGRIGTSTQAFGGTINWLITVINTLSGNLDRPGGAMFTSPAFDIVGITTQSGGTGSYGRWHSRVRNLPEFAGELPVSALGEEILTPGEGQIKGLVTIAGNPVLSTPNGTQLEEALASLDFMVAIDIYLNETTRHAHIILPPTTGLETEHYDLVFHVLAVRNTAKYSEPLFEAGDEARADWQIYSELRDRLLGDKKRPLSHRRHRDLFEQPPGRIVDRALRFGPYGAYGGKKYNHQGNGLSLKELKKQRHGVDLGALEPSLSGRILTPDRQINLLPEIFVNDLPRAEALLHKNAQNGETLLLIGRRQLRSNNSWMHNSRRLMRGKNRCTVLIHPDDAAQRGITSLDEVMVASRVGEIALPAEISEAMMPGVVSIPHGWGHHRPGIRQEVAQSTPGVSINDLTDDQWIDPVTGNVAFSGVMVTVEKKREER